MPKTILLILSLLYTVTFAQTINYFDDSHSWHEIVRHVDDVEDWVEFEYFFKVEGDTTIGDFTYKIITQQGYDTGLYFRQEANSIYQYYGGRDSLYISYDKTVGDTFTEYALTNGETLVIDKVDSLLVGSEYHKVFYLDTLNTGITVIEGIAIRDRHTCTGSMFRRSYVYGGDLSYTGAGIINVYFNAYKEDDSTLLEYTDSYCTQLLSTNSDSDILEFQSTEVYPNPTSGYIYFKISNNSHFELYDLAGGLVKQGKIEDNGIDLTEIKKGIYICVTSPNHNPKIHRIIKQ